MTAMVLLALLIAPPNSEKVVTAAEKKEFLELLAKLPRQGEFFTDEAVRNAVPYTRVLLALTEKDIKNDEIYPFLALSAGLLDRKLQRENGIKEFSNIAHPTFKLFWGAVLFNHKAVSPEIVAFLRAALQSKAQSKRLARMLGPEFEGFKKRVKEHKVKEK